ncbi:MAG: hypothetical protein JXL97_00665 [Bacteroidales bacterium]|nr:hypothetical protein [Bacteroidales bacterium]
MKPTTQNILKWLNSTAIREQIDQFKQTNPNYSFNETTIIEAIDLYNLSKDILLKSIENNILDEQISFTKRQQIHNTLKSLVTQLSQISQPQFKYNAAHPNAAAFAQAIFTGIMNLSDIIDTAKLQERLKDFGNYTTELKELSKVKKAYFTLVNDIEKASELFSKSQNVYKNLNLLSENLAAKIKDLETEKVKTDKISSDTKIVFDNISKSEQDIENKKVKITAFHTNVEEHQKAIAELQTKAQEIIDKEETINNLINQAEKALNLKSAEGVSAAFSSYLTSSNDKKNLRNWMIGASVFILSALALTVWIVSGKWIEHPDAISSIIGRVVAVAISITGATFCAKQYVKQKNILEDYAYKSVLSKSIIAYTEEIKKRDSTKVADYLTQVLGEIHQDPLRQREKHDEKENGVSTPDLMDKLTRIIEILSKK